MSPPVAKQQRSTVVDGDVNQTSSAKHTTMDEFARESSAVIGEYERSCIYIFRVVPGRDKLPNALLYISRVPIPDKY